MKKITDVFPSLPKTSEIQRPIENNSHLEDNIVTSDNSTNLELATEDAES